jgi:hypothetical protein
MSYAQFGLIQATDFNNLVGTNPNTTANVLNTVWSTGGGLSGYGQTAVPTVSVGGTVAASDWANLVNKTANSASHQASSITAVTAPSTGGTVTYLSAIPTNLQTIYTNRANATSQSSTTSNTVTTASTWSSYAHWTHTVSFANGDAARYFFNSGGQIKITMAHSNVTAGINLEWNQLASNVGTVVQSAITSGTANIAGTSYNGITKVGGGGNSPTISSGSGYYAMTTANANAFYQVSSTGPSGYTGSYVNVLIKSNGTQGSNGDAGSVLTIYTNWQEASATGLTVGTGSSVTVTAVPPEVTYIGNSWGAITLSGSVAVS